MSLLCLEVDQRAVSDEVLKPILLVQDGKGD
jgi:hypothetical protein